MIKRRLVNFAKKKCILSFYLSITFTFYVFKKTVDNNFLCIECNWHDNNLVQLKQLSERNESNNTLLSFFNLIFCGCLFVILQNNNLFFFTQVKMNWKIFKNMKCSAINCSLFKCLSVSNFSFKLTLILNNTFYSITFGHMTRINLIHPSELTDQHLLAEHREIKRIPNVISSGKYSLQWAPSEYTIGTWHVKFFYDKLSFLRDRYESIYEECIKRWFQVVRYSESFVHIEWLDNWYTTNKEAIQISKRRIQEKLDMRQWFYRMNWVLI